MVHALAKLYAVLLGGLLHQQERVGTAVTNHHGTHELNQLRIKVAQLLVRSQLYHARELLQSVQLLMEEDEAEQ